MKRVGQPQYPNLGLPEGPYCKKNHPNYYGGYSRIHDLYLYLYIRINKIITPTGTNIATYIIPELIKSSEYMVDLMVTIVLLLSGIIGLLLGFPS